MRRPLTDGDKIRWYWMIQAHQPRSHSQCRLLGDGLCAIKMVRYETWNEERGCWEEEPMPNHATPEQEEVLDSRE